MTAVSPHPRARRLALRKNPAVAGFKVSMAITLVWLSLLVLLPLAALALRPWERGLDHFLDVVLDRRTLASLQLSFLTAFGAACIAAILGALWAWVLVRYRFPGRDILDALIDLPFALPTAVAGIALATLYAPNGAFGAIFHDWFGWKTAYSPLGILIALVFVAVPFVVRALQPVLEDIEPELEEAAATLGAGRWRTFVHVLAPALTPALVSGTATAFARAAGEYGSVIFIAGNLPMVSEIAPLLIVIRLEEFDYAGAAAIGLVMMFVSLVVLVALSGLQHASARWGLGPR
jgi:sulfate/thiosulfate transport system permease protein